MITRVALESDGVECRRQQTAKVRAKRGWVVGKPDAVVVKGLVCYKWAEESWCEAGAGK